MATLKKRTWIAGCAFFYVITSPHFPNVIKIGITEDPVKRLSQYNQYSPYKDYKFALLARCDRCTTTPNALEWYVLCRFQKHRIMGREWLEGVSVEKVRKFIGQWKSVKETTLDAVQQEAKHTSALQRDYQERQRTRRPKSTSGDPI